MVCKPRDHEWIPNATDNSWANCSGRNPQHKNHVIHSLGWSLQLTNITLTFDVKSESIYHGKIRIKFDLERDHCPPSHAIKTTVIWEPENHCRFFVVGRSYARKFIFQKPYFLEKLEYNETNSGHKHTAHMYSSRFQKHLYGESALSRIEVLTKPLQKCNEDRPFYATQNQDIFVQCIEGFNFLTGKSISSI